MRYNEDGNILYIASTLGVIYDRNTQKQRIYADHKHAIVCLDVDPRGKMAATGELHENPEIHVWDARSAKNLATIKNIHRIGVISVSFSASAEYLATLGQDESHSLVVLRSPSHRWDDAYVAYSTSVSHAKMLWVKYIDTNPYPVVCGGQKAIVFFRQAGQGAERARGTFGKKKRIQPVLCAVIGSLMEDPINGGLQATVVTGSVAGDINVWFNQKIINSVAAHQAALYALAKVHTGYASAGREGIIKIWTVDFQCTYTYNVATFTPAPFFSDAIHALSADLTSNRLVVGTRGGCIYEVSIPTHTAIMLVESHSCKELHGLHVNPADADEYVTVGDDGVLRVWSLSMRLCKRRAMLEAASRAVSWAPDGMNLIVGLGGDPKANKKDGKAPASMYSFTRVCRIQL
jgi:WD40 repeat protein